MSKLKVDTLETYDGSSSVAVASILSAGSVGTATAKGTLVDADSIAIADSAAGGALKRVTWAVLKSLLPAAIMSSFRERLSADRSYYVRTDGNDSNTGLTNTPGGAFLTIQKAVDTVAALDLGLYNVTTYCTGTFNITYPTVLKNLVGTGKHIIRGINADMTSMVVSATNSSVWVMGAPGYCGTYDLQYMRMTSAVFGNLIQGAYGGGVLLYSNIDFGPCAGVHIQVGAAMTVRCMGPCTISGGGNAHAAAYDAGCLRMSGFLMTVTGTPNFTNGFALTQRAGIILAYGTTFSGSATGAKYQALENGVISTAGVVFPGNVAGATASGGVYS